MAIIKKNSQTGRWLMRNRDTYQEMNMPTQVLNNVSIYDHRQSLTPPGVLYREAVITYDHAKVMSNGTTVRYNGTETYVSANDSLHVFESSEAATLWLSNTGT